MKKLWIYTLVCLILSSCTVGPDYHTPMPQTQKNWSTSQDAQTATANSHINLTWWKTFNDPLLNRYISEAVTCNIDIQVAQARIRQARAAQRMDIANFYPQVNGTASVQSEQLSKEGDILGFFSNLPFVVNNIQRDQIIYNIGFDAQWEIDIFGKNRRTVESDRATIEQNIENRRKVLLSTISEIARDYIQLRGYQYQLSVARKNVDLQKRTLKIARHRYRVGTINEVDVKMTEAQLKNLEATLPNYIAEIRSNAYQISVLLGKEPQAILKDVLLARKLPTYPRKVPIGLRSDVLRQRPDIREAERQLASAVAEVGVAIADFFPQFTLAGNASFQSVKPYRLFVNSNIAWLFGPSVSWPIFNAGQVSANVEQKRAIAQQYALQYKQTILNALQESESALVRYGQSIETENRYKKAVATNQIALRLNQERYEYGEDDIVSVITSEQSLMNAETSFAQSRTTTLINLISLYKALGGGWEPFEIKPCVKACSRPQPHRAV